MPLIAGAAETVITPPLGFRLEGYFSAGPATSVHDDLHARALVVDDGETRAAVVSCDLIAVDRRLSGPVRRMVHEEAGIPGDRVMVCATHTHAGPPGIGGDVDPEMRGAIARKIVDAVLAASGSMRPAVLKTGAGSVDTVSQNRRDPAFTRDDRLAIVLVDSEAPNLPPIASIINFACHATVLFEDNVQVSADYPGYAISTVKKILGDAPVLFLNGACGDVNPMWMEQHHHEAERVGSIVGAEAARRLQELRPLGHAQRAWNIRWDEVLDHPVTTGKLIARPRIRVASRTVDVPLRVLDTPETYASRLAELALVRKTLPGGDVAGRHRLMEQITMLQGTRGVAAALRRGERHLLHPEIQAISFGDNCAVLGLPGEFFAETGVTIRAASGIEHLLLACYANHHVMYVVPKHAWAEGGYEPGVSILDDTAESIFRNAAIDLLRQVNAA
jgi:hypothetical protein